VVLTLERVEARLLRDLPGQLRTLIEDPDPDDPAVARLFPTAVAGDDEADAEVRRLIFDDLLRERLDALEEVSEVLASGTSTRWGRVEVELTGEQPHLVLGVLNDIRLTLGARVGIERLDREEVDRDHPAAATVAVIDHLGWIQEVLLRVVDPPSAAEESH
jgi:hypothetical protein